LVFSAGGDGDRKALRVEIEFTANLLTRAALGAGSP
jgi:hypothetical protein